MLVAAILDMAELNLISGHGCFRSYLMRFGHEDADDCPWCGGGRSETAEHVLFSCVKYTRERSSLETVLGGRLNADNLVPFMLQGEAEWQAVNSFAAAITTELRRAERARRVHE
ncbi:GD11539 [Drosophila simulans]|uniref:GD11539 n=1 Tax=Drosophila simulans TaxID=7240 RepID=B4QF51_DROSI|nr:GD11539 [Drosophila simulans]